MALVKDINDLERVMALMGTHRIEILEIEGIKLNRSLFDPITTSMDREDTGDTDEDILFAHVRG